MPNRKPRVLAKACIGMLAIAALAATSTVGLAQEQVRPDLVTGFRTITAGELKADLDFIASDALAGRLTLSPGDEAATEWIAKQFARAGLKPAAMDEHGLPTFLQPVHILAYAPDPAASLLSLARHGQKTSWRAPEISGAFRRPVDVTAPVVFAGYGITAPGLKYDDYSGVDVRGKVVLIFEHEPQEQDPRSIFNGTGLTLYSSVRLKVLNAQRHGALAVLIAGAPNRTYPSAAEGYARNSPLPTRSRPPPVESRVDEEIQIPALTVTDDIAQAFLDTNTPGLKQVQASIDQRLQPQSRQLAGTLVTLRLRNVWEHAGTTRNVAGLLEGSDPQLKADTVVVSAHHDHDGWEPCPAAPPRPAILPDPHYCPYIWHGADDNGSGTVGVVALARAFAANPRRPKRSILFIVFAGEDRGLLGSYEYVARPLRPLPTTRAVINFDMIGRDEAPSAQTQGLIKIPADTSNELNLVGLSFSPDYGRAVVAENAHVGLVLDDKFDRDSALNMPFRSDQAPFLLAGVPAAWWFTGFHPDYHHTTDNADKINLQKMVRVLQLAYLSLWYFGSTSRPPTFVPNPHS